MADRFEDKRGVIQDLLGPVDSVTEITTKAGHVRGNHIHHETMQWVYVVSGAMLVAHESADGDRREAVYTAGCFFAEPPGIPHAWRAEQDTRVLVFTQGPRSGEAFESDTQRLPQESWLLTSAICGACHRPATPGYPLSVVSGGAWCHQVCPQPG